MNSIEFWKRVKKGDNCWEWTSQAVNGYGKLTTEKAIEIKARVAAGERREDLAAEYGVGRRTIDRAISGECFNYKNAQVSPGVSKI